MGNSRARSLSAKWTRPRRPFSTLGDRAYRAAITAEGDEDDKARQDPDAEAREFDKLLQGASIMPFLNEALEGKETRRQRARNPAPSC